MYPPPSKLIQKASLHYQKPAGERLDQFLAEELADFSRSRLQSLIRQGQAVVNGAKVLRPSYLLRQGDQIELTVPRAEPNRLVPEPGPLDVLYEDENVLVVNKAAGMVVYPAAGHRSGTLMNAVLAHAPELGSLPGDLRPGVVHRLDKDTSGVLIIAKNDRSQRWLQEQFRTRAAQKEYLALVDGHPPTRKGRIEAPIGRDPTHRQRMAIVGEGKGRPAVTEFEAVENFREHTLLSVRPLTGRTHQIRVHLASVGCPVSGDLVYGRGRSTLGLNRFFLHAKRLTLRLPGADRLSNFEAPLPAELVAVLEQLRITEGEELNGVH